MANMLVHKRYSLKYVQLNIFLVKIYIKDVSCIKALQILHFSAHTLCKSLFGQSQASVIFLKDLQGTGEAEKQLQMNVCIQKCLEAVPGFSGTSVQLIFLKSLAVFVKALRYCFPLPLFGTSIVAP